jgi:hypothetical protein
MVDKFIPWHVPNHLKQKINRTVSSRAELFLILTAESFWSWLNLNTKQQ